MHLLLTLTLTLEYYDVIILVDSSFTRIEELRTVHTCIFYFYFKIMIVFQEYI